MKNIASAKSALSQPRSQSARLPGLHLIGDFYGCRCDYRHMIDRESIEKLCLRLVQEAGLRGDFGPLGTEVEGDRDEVLDALRAVMAVALDAGATRITLQLHTES